MFILAAAAAACGKYEKVSPLDGRDVEITFAAAPVTRALSEFDTQNVFQSTAYALASDKAWQNSACDATQFILPNTVSWEEVKWRMETRHYWPAATRALTFYSWTLNSSTLAFSGSSTNVGFSATEGVSLKNYDISVEGNTDFMVADPATDKVKSTASVLTDGVPTIFKHKLSKVQIAVRTKEDYSPMMFRMCRIDFTNVAQQADYQECQWDDADSPKWSVIDKWSNHSGTYDARYADYSTFQNLHYKTGQVFGYNGGTPKLLVTYTDTEDSGYTDWFEIRQQYFIPETFDGNEEIKLTYQCIPNGGSICMVTEKSAKLKDVIGTAFEAGKLYTINVVVGLDEVTFDPVIEDWTDVNKDITLE